MSVVGKERFDINQNLFDLNPSQTHCTDKKIDF